MEPHRWLPLEANPDVTNQFLKQLGIHPDWQFVDVYGMEPELLSMVPRPVCAVLLLFPITEKYETFRTEEEERIKAKGQDVKSSVYFMKQTINNACGTIGLIHAIANNREKMNFETNSSLKKFLEDSLSMTPEERAKYLETYEAIRVTHESSAHEGQTECLFNIPPSLLQGLLCMYYVIWLQTDYWVELLCVYRSAQLSVCRTRGRSSDPSAVHMTILETKTRTILSPPISKVSSDDDMQSNLL
uniref:Ubiquitin carboxyl-terminal hydrolase n=1 Tax=Gallus gallus TaxID=9031 RepID=A0A8V0X931_CHICK